MNSWTFVGWLEPVLVIAALAVLAVVVYYPAAQMLWERFRSGRGTR